MKIILVGSSPVMLLKAIILRSKYKNAKIEIHEKSYSVGGSWKTINFSNFKFIETGSHIFAPYKSLKLYNQCHKILKRKLKLSTYFLKTKPLNIINHNIQKNELSKAKYFYIKGGSGELLNKLIKLAKKKKIKIIYKSCIQKIFYDNYKYNLRLFNKNLWADQIYLPYYCKFNLNCSNMKRFFYPTISIHIIIKIPFEYNFRRKVSYIQKVNFSDLFDRLSNLSDTFDLKNHIFCLRVSENIKKKFYKNKKKYIHNIKSDLIKYLKPNLKNVHLSKKINHKIVKYETNYRDKKQLEELEIFSKTNKINLVDTSEFIKYMSKNINILNKI